MTSKELKSEDILLLPPETTQFFSVATLSDFTTAFKRKKKLQDHSNTSFSCGRLLFLKTKLLGLIDVFKLEGRRPFKVFLKT